MNERLNRLQAELAAKQLPALLVFSEPNRRYLSGFTGSSGVLLVTAAHAVLLTDSRYTEQAAAETRSSGFEVLEHHQPWTADLAKELTRRQINALAYDPEEMTVAEWQRLQSALPQCSWQQVDGLVSGLRQIKEPSEIAALAAACRITDEALTALLPRIAVGVRELELAMELEWYMRTHGAQGIAFDFIVASGPRSALPHGHATERQIHSGDFVTFDIGAVVEGYHSDMTRTVAVGSIDQTQRQVYDVVLKAQLAGLQALAVGVTGEAVDHASRSVIEQAGYGPHFGHGTGHAVGLEIHEGPRLAPGSQQTLRAGMALTIEPGIYLPQRFGVRIEDTVVLKAEAAHQVLTHFPKELMVL